MLPFWLKYLFAATSGILLFFSFPPFEAKSFGFIGLVPLLVALRMEKRLLHCGFLGFTCGLFFFGGLLYWVAGIKIYQVPVWMLHLGWVLIALVFSLYFFLFGLALGFLEPRLKWAKVLVAPFIWTALEYLRSLYPLGGFPWGILGYSQYQNLVMIQIADITGVFGVSFLLLLVNSALVSFFLDIRGFREKSRISQRRPPIYTNLSLSFCLLVVVCVFGYGWNAWKKQKLVPEMKVAIVQSNIKIEDSWAWEVSKQEILKRLTRLTQEAAKERPDLIIWTETAVLNSPDQSIMLKHKLCHLAREAKSYLLVGAPYIDPKNKYYNSAFLISSEGKIVDRYDKMHLVPYGEMLPGEKTFPWLRKAIPQAGYYSAGRKFTVFQVPVLVRLTIVKFNTLICFEGIFGDLTRRFVKQQAQFMVNITNDAWSKTKAAYYQHFSMATFRAVENRAYFLRAGNTGVSAIIDPVGRITKKLKIGQEGIIVAEISLARKKTFYTRYGDFFARLCLIVTLGLMFLRRKPIS